MNARRGAIRQTLGAMAGEGRCCRSEVVEWSLQSAVMYDDPFNDVTLDAEVVDPRGRKAVVPGYWAGGQSWRLRFCPSSTGTYALRTLCSHRDDHGLNDLQASLVVDEYRGDNPLLTHGPLAMARGERFLQHVDGTPFLWLADTWWLGLTDRLDWPNGFDRLAARRQEQGFTVVQLLAGLYCDMAAHDHRGANEGGLAWEEGDARINPAFFDAADRRIDALVAAGIVPCIFGSWSYYLLSMGRDKMRQHWRYLIARCGAYPVIWCLDGGGTMPFYTSESKAVDRARLRRGWSELAHYVRESDPYRHPLAIHPGPGGSGRDVLAPDAPFDLTMHHVGGLASRLWNDLSRADADEAEEPLPSLYGEVCYPGILGRDRQHAHRAVFWMTMLAGAAGYTYGMNGIWQFETARRPFGASPNGRSWPSSPWEEVSTLSSAREVGIGRELLERYRWWEFTSHPEWVTPHADAGRPWLPHAGGIPNEVRIIYIPEGLAGEIIVQKLEPDTTYTASRVDPATGMESALWCVSGQPTWRVQDSGQGADWLLILEKGDIVDTARSGRRHGPQ